MNEHVSAVIIRDSRVLLLQQPDHCWGLPGGPDIGNNSHHEALGRVLRAEVFAKDCIFAMTSLWCGRMVTDGPFHLVYRAWARPVAPVHAHGWFSLVDIGQLSLAPLVRRSYSSIKKILEDLPFQYRLHSLQCLACREFEDKVLGAARCSEWAETIGTKSIQKRAP